MLTPGLSCCRACLLLVLLQIPCAVEAIDNRGWSLLQEAAERGEIAANLSIDGRPIRIRSLRFERPLEAVLHSYRHWSGAQRIEHRLGGWQIIAHLQDGRFMMLRMRSQGEESSIGTLSETEALAVLPDRKMPEGLVPPAGSSLGPVIFISDEGRRTRMVSLSNEQSSALNSRHFRAQLEARGYRLQHALPVARQQPGYSFLFAAPDGEALLTVFEQPRPGRGASVSTAVTLSIVHHDSRPGGSP